MLIDRVVKSFKIHCCS